MINLVQDQQNYCIMFPVRDQVLWTATTDYYVVRATNKEAMFSKDFLVEDVSANRTVFQGFYITLTGGTESVNEGIVDLRPSGYWEFKLYGSTGNTISDIDESKVLSSGFIRITDE